jgi:cytochrome c553
MKRLLISIATLGLVAWNGLALAGDAAEMAETCIDCHEMSEFKGKDFAELEKEYHEGIAQNKMMAKATSDLSPDDVKAILEYIATEANK